MKKKILRFTSSRRPAFFQLHRTQHNAGWCFCVAWWVPTWDKWGERTAQENLLLRQDLCDRGEYDGYLLYVDDAPVGWCQVGPRDRLTKLTQQFKLPPDPETWAITCFLIAPAYRRQGLATYLLREVLRDLRRCGVHRIEVFPRRGKGLGGEDFWTGPEPMFCAAGFNVARDDPKRPIYVLELHALSHG